MNQTCGGLNGQAEKQPNEIAMLRDQRASGKNVSVLADYFGSS